MLLYWFLVHSHCMPDKQHWLNDDRQGETTVLCEKLAPFYTPQIICVVEPRPHSARSRQLATWVTALWLATFGMHTPNTNFHHNFFYSFTVAIQTNSLLWVHHKNAFERLCFMSCSKMFTNFHCSQCRSKITATFFQRFEHGVFNNAVSNLHFIAPSENNEL